MDVLVDHRLRRLGDIPVTLQVGWEALRGGLNPPSSSGETEQVATAKPLLCCLIFGSVHGCLSCLPLCVYLIVFVPLFWWFDYPKVMSQVPSYPTTLRI